MSLPDPGAANPKRAGAKRAPGELSRPSMMKTRQGERKKAMM
jgi:hypothetical protein